MTTISQDIRGALHAQAITASGFPGTGLIAEEGMPFTPADGTTWVSVSFRPASQRPFSVAGGAVIRNKGLYQLNVRTPSGQGTAAADSLADAIKDVFRPGTKLSIGGNDFIMIEYAERYAAVPDAEWTVVPVQIQWVVYSTR